MRQVGHRLAHVSRPLLDGTAKRRRGDERQSKAEKAPEREHGRQAERDCRGHGQEERVLQAGEDSVDQQRLDARHVGTESREQIPMPERFHCSERRIEAAREERRPQIAEHIGGKAGVNAPGPGGEREIQERQDDQCRGEPRNRGEVATARDDVDEGLAQQWCRERNGCAGQTQNEERGERSPPAGEVMREAPE